MQLLQRGDDGKFSLTEFILDKIPPYAILSHTWGPPYMEEMTYNDLVKGTGASKKGFRKLQFCATQAERDGLRYFWIDTCCINKSSSSELSEAINSAFSWYRNAARCYVFLSDVSIEKFPSATQAFQRSRWFTRGWTLQELIAPPVVQFFSMHAEIIGDKSSMEKDICKITGIQVEALRGAPLSRFSVAERMAWAEHRHTAREEDAAYSLLGIFDVHMPLIYGEGREKAFARLWREIQMSNKDSSYLTLSSDRIATTIAKGLIHFPRRIHSSARTPTLTSEKLSAQHSDSEDESDIASVFSDGASSVSSTSTTSLSPVETIGVREVSLALLSNENLRVAYTKALVDFQLRKERWKARSQLRNFLNIYGHNLLEEASDNGLEFQAAKFVLQLAGRITDEIIWNITGFAARPYLPKKGLEKQDLETWLSTIESEKIRITDKYNPPQIRAAVNETFEEGESDEEVGNVPFPNIDKVRDFLLTSKSLERYVTAMQTWTKIKRDDGRDEHKSTIGNAKPLGVVESAEEIDEDTITFAENQENGDENLAAADLEDHVQQDIAHELDSRAPSQQPKSSAKDLTSGLLDFWGVSFFLYDIVELFVPSVPDGCRRLRWRCSCNTVLWGDFLIEDDDAFERLKRQLLRSTDTPAQRVAPSGTPKAQTTEHSGATDSGSVHVQQTIRTNALPSLSRPFSGDPTNASSPNAVDAAPVESDHVVNIMYPPGYFEVCVSTGNHAIDHHEIDISRINSDSELFELIWDKYNLTRGTGLRRIFLRPSDVNFVMFSISRRNQYGAGIHKKPDEFPPQHELEEKRYHYLCPRIRMPANVFLHYLHRARWNIWGEHTENTWLQRLPKKLNKSLLFEALLDNQQAGHDALADPDLAFGWGIHIIEGPNHAALGLLLAVGVAVAFLVYGLVVGFAKTQEQGFGIGNFLLAIIASSMVAIYFQLQD